MDVPTSIGFPVGLLAEAPVRMDVLAAGPGWVALDKPAGVAFDDLSFRKHEAFAVRQDRC